MSRPKVNVRAMADELRVVLDDDCPHHRSELLSLARRYHGTAKHYRRAVARLKDGGFYVEGGEFYTHRTVERETTNATARALCLRSVPELSRRIRALRGEMIRAEKRGEILDAYVAALAMFETTLAAEALAAGLSPATAIIDSFLTADQEASIKAE